MGQSISMVAQMTRIAAWDVDAVIGKNYMAGWWHKLKGCRALS